MYLGSDAKALQKVIGKKIVKIKYPREWDDGAKNWIHTPLIILDGGYALAFTTEEGEGDYGTKISVHKL